MFFMVDLNWKIRTFVVISVAVNLIDAQCLPHAVVVKCVSL